MSYERKNAEVEALRLAVAIYDQDGGLLADKGEWANSASYCMAHLN